MDCQQAAKEEEGYSRFSSKSYLSRSITFVADIDSAVAGALMANFYSQGQVCSNASKVDPI